MKFILSAVLLGLIQFQFVQANECLVFLFESASNSPVESHQDQLAAAEDDLQARTINLPGRGHQFSAEEFANLSPENQFRVKTLQAGINVMDRSEVVLALKAINQPLVYFTDDASSVVIPEALLALIKSSVNADHIKDNFIFFKSYLKEGFTEEELMGLSLLFPEVKRIKKPVPAISFTPKTKAERTQYINYLTSLLSRPHIANSLIRFLTNEWIELEAEVAMHREHVISSNRLVEDLRREEIINKNFDSVAIYDTQMRLIKKVYQFDSAKLKDEYQRNKKFTTKSMNVIMLVLDRYSELLFEYYAEKVKSALTATERFDPNSRPPTMYELTRPERLIYIESFLTDEANFKSVLGNLVDLIDHLLFGSSMPLKTDDLENMIQASVKYWLLPVRSQLTTLKINENKAKQSIPTAIVPTAIDSEKDAIILSPAWGHSPVEESKPNPNKRRNQTHRQSAKESSQPQVAGSAVTAIPAEIDLAQFSPFVENPRAITELEADRIYKFRFMRDGEDSRIYTLEFKEDILKEFSYAPEIATQLMRALNLGFARTKHEDGLKILKANRKGQPGRLYELKSRKYYIRLILQHVDGHWKVLEYTDKTNFDRVLNSMI